MVNVATTAGPPKADSSWCQNYHTAPIEGGDPLPMLSAHIFVPVAGILREGQHNPLCIASPSSHFIAGEFVLNTHIFCAITELCLRIDYCYLSRANCRDLERG